MNRRTFARTLAGVALGLATAGVGAWAFAEPPPMGRAPDPQAPSTTRQWVFELAVNRGTVTPTRVTSATVKAPIATARVMGRYALELYVGRQLLDRVRFDVPLAAEGPRERDPKRPFARPTFEKLSMRLRVQMADSPRAAWGVLLDRATGELARFWWPPEPDGRLLPRTPSPADAGAGDSAKADADLPSDAGSPSEAGSTVARDGG